MKIDIYFINAFTKQVNAGNPACVVPLKKWLPHSTMLAIAKENKVAETAFFIKKKNSLYELKWFTPDIEMDLCGHATLATAHHLFTTSNELKEIQFKTKSGVLKVSSSNGFYNMILPRREGKLAKLPIEIKNSLNILPKEIYKSRDYLLVYNSQTEIKSISINRKIFDQININPGGVIVTAIGDNYDFVSRFFTPQATFLEDPVTGSAHCTLTPYWSKRLKKNKLKAAQLSERGGEIYCIDEVDSVVISGKAVTCSQVRKSINPH